MNAKTIRFLSQTAGFALGVGCALSAFAGNASFLDVSDIPLTNNAWTVATADLMGNGHQDILSGDGSLLMGDGMGGFTPGPSQAPAQSVAFADINGDGKPDLIEVNYGNQIAVFINTTQPGDTTPSFAAPQYFDAGNGLSMVVAADLNGDGAPDLVAIDTGISAVDVLINTTPQGAGNDTVTFTNFESLQAGNQVNWIAVGDLNGDGQPDIVAVNNMDNTISVFMNETIPQTSLGVFLPQQVFSVGSFPNGLAIADLDGDGKQDVIVSSQGIDGNGNNFVSVLLNTTAQGSLVASFAAEETFITGSNPDAVIAVDVDGDGKADIITANSNDCTVSVLRNTTAHGASTASFAGAQAYGTGVDPEDLVAADLNGDGLPDLVVMDTAGYAGWPSVSVLLRQTN